MLSTALAEFISQTLHKALTVGKTGVEHNTGRWPGAQDIQASTAAVKRARGWSADAADLLSCALKSLKNHISMN